MMHLPWSVLLRGNVQGRGCTGGCAAAFAGRGKVPFEFCGDKGTDIKKSPVRVCVFSSAAVHQPCVQKVLLCFISANACGAWAAESSRDRTGGAEVLSITSAACPAMPPQPDNLLSGQTRLWRKQKQHLRDACCKTTGLACSEKFQEVFLWWECSTS